jgi:hypothetical protein
VEPKGGLCGLAALHWALADTLLTPSQLLAMGYKDMRAAIGAAMGVVIAARVVDEALLEDYGECKIHSMPGVQGLYIYV